MKRSNKTWIYVILSCSFVWDAGWSQELGEDLTEWSMEELLNINISLVSRKSESRTRAPAATSVLTQEDIRRSGARSIAEALRLVPGFQVARADANKWAITSRGFNSRFADKLLVQIDGRSVYSSLFTGVYWEVQDLVLDDIDRIEVVRGPGASLWGANAVNGIINIITRQARHTQGNLVVLGGGTEERGFGNLRYGGRLADGLHYRVYGKYFDRDGLVDAVGRDAGDSWNTARGGFRLDWQGSGRDEFTLHGDIYSGEVNDNIGFSFLGAPFVQTTDEPIALAGGNLVGRWRRIYSADADLALQVYYDNAQRDEVFGKQREQTLDMDFQHHFGLFDRQDMVWGLGYRLNHIDDIQGSYAVNILTESQFTQLLSAFVQSDIALVPQRWRLIGGAKFEHNDYTGFELQPSLRTSWTPTENQTLWGAVSHAVRTPSRADDESRVVLQEIPAQLVSDQIPSGMKVLAVYSGNHNFDAEKLTAYELGYRSTALERVSLDLAAFYNRYQDLRAVEQNGEPKLEASPTPHVVVPIRPVNTQKAQTYGIEVSTVVQLLSRWQLQSNYTLLKIEKPSAPIANPIDLGSDGIGDGSPQHQVLFWSKLDLPHGVELDSKLRYVDALKGQDVAAYWGLDLRLGLQVSPRLNLSIVGENLLDDHHLEFHSNAVDTMPTQVERGFYVLISWKQ